MWWRTISTSTRMWASNPSKTPPINPMLLLYSKFGFLVTFNKLDKVSVGFLSSEFPTELSWPCFALNTMRAVSYRPQLIVQFNQCIFSGNNATLPTPSKFNKYQLKPFSIKKNPVQR